MDKITRIGVDLAKNVIQLHGVDSMERVVVRKAISRHVSRMVYQPRAVPSRDILAVLAVIAAMAIVMNRVALRFIANPSAEV